MVVKEDNNLKSDEKGILSKIFDVSIKLFEVMKAFRNKR